MDPHDVANQLVKKYGGDAAAKALMRVLEKRILDDSRGERIWLAVLNAVMELQHLNGERDSALH